MASPYLENKMKTVDHYGKRSKSQAATSETNSNKTNATSYIPYSYKDFQNMQKKGLVKLGGLGANIGSEDWKTAQKKQLVARLFGEKVQRQNNHS